MSRHVFHLILVFAAFLLSGRLWAAFEPVAHSPWLLAGPASSLFPRTPLALITSPFAAGLLEGGGVAASASRPFGLRELDRCAVAGSVYLSGDVAAGGALTLSGSEQYSEFSVVGSCAVRIAHRTVAGLSAAVRRLQISGYGTGTGFSGDIGIAFSPVDGIYAAGAVRGVLRTGLGDSGDPAGPRGVDLAVGLCPGTGVTVVLGAGREENLPVEFSVSSSFSPDPMLALGGCIRTDPLRFSFSLSASVSKLDLGYGYTGHETLPGTHSISLCWGGCAADPVPVNWSTGNEESVGVSFPLNVNTATEEELELIPGIGPAKASAIVAWLESHGPVSSITELIEVPGIGPTILSVLLEYLRAE
jgi:competence ComEA-like helix-hairpin-helix protein